jgi:hypothetical protein
MKLSSFYQLTFRSPIYPMKNKLEELLLLVAEIHFILQSSRINFDLNNDLRYLLYHVFQLIYL